jgi:hypothetical protein
MAGHYAKCWGKENQAWSIPQREHHVMGGGRDLQTLRTVPRGHSTLQQKSFDWVPGSCVTAQLALADWNIVGDGRPQ